MQIIRDLHSIKTPFEKSVVTIGNFDGIHIGHRKIIRETVSCAKKTGGKSVVITFSSHPRKMVVGAESIPLITSQAHKLSLIQNLGVDICLLLDFSRELARLSAKDFVKKVLIGKLGVKHLFVGFNFTFGHNKTGNVDLLKKFGREYGFKVKIIKPVVRKRITVSSTVIRKLISTGDLSLASALLGREYSLYGTVVRGDRLGRLLGYPTANIFPYNEVIPPTGVYVVRAVYAGKVYDGILNIGVKPTFRFSEDIRMSIEVHIFNFDKVIYGENLEIFFIEKLREEFKFSHKEDLIKQIKQDEIAARKILKKTKGLKFK